MLYNLDEFTRLVGEVESQGGALLPEVCEGTLASFPMPNSEKAIKTYTCNCKSNGMVVAPYSPSGDTDTARSMIDKGAGFVRACVVCDSVGAWPRFAHTMKEPEEV